MATLNLNITARRPKYKTPRVEYWCLFGSVGDKIVGIDLTHAVTNISFSSAITPPWQTATVSFLDNVMSMDVSKKEFLEMEPHLRPSDWGENQKIQWRNFYASKVVPQTPGYLKITDPNLGVVWGGYVDQYVTQGDSGGATGGTIVQERATIKAIGYLDLANRANVGIIPRIKIRANLLHKFSTFFDLAEWKQIALNTVKDAQGNSDMGVSLKNFWKSAAKIVFPPHILNGGTYIRQFLKDYVKVCHNQATADAAGYGSACSEIPGTYQSNLLHNTIHGGTLGGMLRNTYMPDEHMVEMFPVTHGNKALLIYRMKPLRTLSSVQYTTAGKHSREGGSYSHQNPEAPNPSAAVGTAIPVHFGAATWAKLKTHHIYAEEIFKYDFHYNESRAVNVVTAAPANHSDAATFYMDLSGLPIFNSLDAAHQGGRVYRPQWPFVPPIEKDLPPGTTGSTRRRYKTHQKNYAKWMRAVAYEAAQIMLGKHRFFAGTVETQYRPDIRHGDRLFIHDIFELKASKKVQKGISGEAHYTFDPNAVTTNLEVFKKSRTMAAYITRISHNLMVGPNKSIIKKSVIEFDYGLPPSQESNRTNPIYRSDFEELVKPVTPDGITGTGELGGRE